MKTGKRKNTAIKWIIGILAAAAAAVLIFILSIFAIARCSIIMLR